MQILHSYIQSTSNPSINKANYSLTLQIDIRSKGLTENQLAELGYSDTIIFRPGYLANAERSGTRIMESLAAYVLLSVFAFATTHGISQRPISKLASYVSSSIQIDVRTFFALIMHLVTHSIRLLIGFCTWEKYTSCWCLRHLCAS